MITLLRVWFYLVFPLLFQSIHLCVYWLALHIRFIGKQVNIRGPLVTVNGLLGLFYLMLFLVLQLFKPSGFADLYPAVFADGALSVWSLFRGTIWVAMVTFLSHWVLLLTKGKLSFMQSLKISGSCTTIAYMLTVFVCVVLF